MVRNRGKSPPRQLAASQWGAGGGLQQKPQNAKLSMQVGSRLVHARKGHLFLKENKTDPSASSEVPVLLSTTHNAHLILTDIRLQSKGVLIVSNYTYSCTI